MSMHRPLQWRYIVFGHVFGWFLCGLEFYALPHRARVEPIGYNSISQLLALALLNTVIGGYGLVLVSFVSFAFVSRRIRVEPVSLGLVWFAHALALFRFVATNQRLSESLLHHGVLCLLAFGVPGFVVGMLHRRRASGT
jgi:hypothetical protein